MNAADLGYADLRMAIIAAIALIGIPVSSAVPVVLLSALVTVRPARSLTPNNAAGLGPLAGLYDISRWSCSHTRQPAATCAHHSLGCAWHRLGCASATARDDRCVCACRPLDCGRGRLPFHAARGACLDFCCCCDGVLVSRLCADLCSGFCLCYASLLAGLPLS